MTSSLPSSPPSSRRKPGSSQKSGFTLIEVLVALAIVTVGMAAVMGAMTSAADTAFYLRDKTFAQWVALNRIAEVRLERQLPAKGKSKGEAEMAGRKWIWEQDVQPLKFKGMWRIDVSVRPAEVAKSTNSAWYSTQSGVMGDALNYEPGAQDGFDLNKAIVQLTPP